jgi:hypothetical protein
MAQNPKQYDGVIKGVVRDTLHNSVLKSATVSVYRSSDSTLLSFQLTNAIGEFRIDKLPVNLPVRVAISHIGYKPFERNFIISVDSKIFDFKNLELTYQEVNLKEVVINNSAISLNNDTLEINTSAFKLDPNAVIEDVLRRTPGVVLWGDGSITVNGKPVKNVLVDGKSFFGGNPKIALQNLNKNSVSKVQVYKEKNYDNILDSNLIMNLKLKASQKMGAFGKLGAGLGSGNHYEVDGNVNFYNAKSQLALIAAINDVNKFTDDAQTLLVNSTFKGTGANLNYKSDFQRNGINKTRSGGFIFSHDFKEKPVSDDNRKISIDYFGQNNDFENAIRSETNSILSEDNNIYTSNVNSNLTKKTTQIFNSKYEDISENKRLTIEQTIKDESNKGESNVISNSLNNNRELISSNKAILVNDISGLDYKLQTEWQNKRYVDHSIFNKSRIKYSFALKLDDFISNNSSAFSLVQLDSVAEKNRKYDNYNQLMNHNLALSLPNIIELGNQWYLGSSNDISLDVNFERNMVSDFSRFERKFLSNADLTNRLKYNAIDEKAGIYLNKTILKKLSNRYAKSLELKVGGLYNYIGQNSSSQHSIQNINRSYSNFLPYLSITLNNQIFGLYAQAFSLSFKEQIDIPQIWQLAPLTDDINVYQLRYGNLMLREARQKTFQLLFQHLDLNHKNTFNLTANLNGSIITNGFSDSSIVDKTNRVFLYPINVKKILRVSLNMILNKSFKLKNSELQLRLASSPNFNSLPGFINSKYVLSRYMSFNNKLSFFYRYKEMFEVETVLGYSPTISKQIEFDTKYKSTNYSSALSASYSPKKWLTINSNLDYIKNTSNIQYSTNYLVWNASLILRFFKLNNGEVKISAFDLLRQNTNLINLTGSNFATIGSQHVLQNYFMTTFSYYPRLFKKL